MFNARNSGQLYLPGVEAHHQPGPYQKLVADAKSRGAEYSKIWDLFAFKNELRRGDLLRDHHVRAVQLP
jgi:hypothetical protein